jgi:hypothetical protein
VIHDKMIKEYVEQYERENKIFHEVEQPITHITVLSLSFKSTWGFHRRLGGDPQLERTDSPREAAVGQQHHRAHRRT